MPEIVAGVVAVILMAAVYCAVVEHIYNQQADEKDDELGEEGDE